MRAQILSLLKQHYPLLVGGLSVFLALSWTLIDMVGVPFPWFTENLPKAILFVLGAILIAIWQERIEVLDDIRLRMQGPRAFAYSSGEDTYRTAHDMLNSRSPVLREVYLTDLPVRPHNSTPIESIRREIEMFEAKYTELVNTKGERRWTFRQIANIPDERTLNEWLDYLEKRDDAENYEVKAFAHTNELPHVDIMAVGQDQVLWGISRKQQIQSEALGFSLEGEEFVKNAKDYFQLLWSQEGFLIRDSNGRNENQIALLRQELKPKFEFIVGRDDRKTKMLSLLEEAETLTKANVIERKHIYMVNLDIAAIYETNTARSDFETKCQKLSDLDWRLVQLSFYESGDKLDNLADNLKNGWLHNFARKEIRYFRGFKNPLPMEILILDGVGAIVTFPTITESELNKISLLIRDSDGIGKLTDYINDARIVSKPIPAENFEDPEFYKQVKSTVGQPIEVTKGGKLHKLASQIITDAPTGTIFRATGFSRETGTEDSFKDYTIALKERLEGDRTSEYIRAVFSTPGDLNALIENAKLLSQVPNAEITLFIERPEFPDVLITEDIVAMGFPDPDKAFRLLWDGLVIRDPEAVKLFTEWFQQHIEHSDLKKFHLKKTRKTTLEEGTLDEIKNFLESGSERPKI